MFGDGTVPRRGAVQHLLNGQTGEMRHAAATRLVARTYAANYERAQFTISERDGIAGAREGSYQTLLAQRRHNHAKLFTAKHECGVLNFKLLEQRDVERVC